VIPAPFASYPFLFATNLPAVYMENITEGDMGEDTDGEAITLMISHQELEFILGALSILRTDLKKLADTNEQDNDFAKAHVHRMSAEKAEELERRLITLL
jgi:hypothetical protein